MGIDTRALKDMQAFRRRGGEVWKAKEGGNIIRIIPFLHVGHEYAYLQTARHWKLRPDTAAPVGCPRALFGNPCYADEFIGDKLSEVTSLEDAAYLKAIAAQDCIVFNVVDREFQMKMGGKGKVQLFWSPPGLGFDILDRIADEAKRPDFLSFENGFDFHINRDKDARRMYTLDIVDRSSISAHYQLEAKDLFTYITAPSSAWMKAVLNPDLKSDGGLPDEDQRSRVDVLGEPHENPGSWAGYITKEFLEESEPVEVNTSEVKTAKKRTTLADVVKKRKSSKEKKKPLRNPVLDQDDELPDCCGTPTDPGKYLVSDPACSQCLATEYCSEWTPMEDEVTTENIKSDPPFDGFPDGEPELEPESKPAAAKKKKSTSDKQKTKKKSDEELSSPMARMRQARLAAKKK